MSHYTTDEAAEFNSYIDRQLEKVDLDGLTDEDRTYMRNMMLTMYSNPLRNKLHR